MNSADLVHMANQIGQHFQAYGTDEAVAGIQTHVLRYWHPDLRLQLIALAAHDDTALLHTVRRAALRLREPNS